MSKNNKDFYENLKNLLNDTSNWPSDYIFKFIFPTDKKNIDIIYDIFDDFIKDINFKSSRNKKYTSASVLIIADSPDLIISFYKKVSGSIENIILL